MWLGSSSLSFFLNSGQEKKKGEDLIRRGSLQKAKGLQGKSCCSISVLLASGVSARPSGVDKRSVALNLGHFLCCPDLTRAVCTLGEEGTREEENLSFYLS